MRFTLDSLQCRNFDISSRKEWLLANGIGGFAMGTASGANMRRYHGLLVAAVKPPAYRMVLLDNLEIELQADGIQVGLSCNHYSGTVFPDGFHYLEEFSIGNSAFWQFKSSGLELQKRVILHPKTNAVTIALKNNGKKPYRMVLRPLVCHRFYHGNFNFDPSYPDALVMPKDRTVVEKDGVVLSLSHPGAERGGTSGWYYRFDRLREDERGLDGRDDLFCPCELTYSMAPGQTIYLVAAAGEPPEPITTVAEEPAVGLSLRDALVAATDRFIIESEDRTSIMAGYPWFTDWGRDTMISLPGIMLHTGRVAMARQVLEDYASQMSQGLIPNRFVEVGEQPEYNTVDATLWFVHAVHQTLLKEWDKAFAKRIWPKLLSFFEWHQKGTRYGIQVDSSDGLLTQGEEGVQLTWMDAKIGDYVVTPRRGKPVEINGLWINALRVMEWLGKELGEIVEPIVAAAELAERNFDAKFWRPTLGYYLDTADPDDGSLRPNQLIAMSLPFGPARGENAKLALDHISRELLTPVGMRTLAPESPHYRAQFRGPLPELDQAYHQGTVWPWLMGPYITALVKVTGAKGDARRILKNGRNMLMDQGIGGLCEVYDGDEPRQPGGCPFQAWSVAEWLRAWIEDAEGN